MDANHVVRTLAVWLALVTSALAQPRWQGEQMPVGDILTEGADWPNGKSYTVRGSGGGRSGERTNGTQICPTKHDQPFIARIGEAPISGVALGCSIRDVSFWGADRKPFYPGDGLVLRAWGGLSIENVGFHGCGRGLVLDNTQKGTGLSANKIWAANCETGIYVDTSKYKNRVVNRGDGWYLNGNAVGAEFVYAGPKPFIVRDVYCEANTRAGIIVRAGTVVLDGMYNEHQDADLNGDGKKDLVPGVAILGGKVVLRDLEFCNYLYCGKAGYFEADVASTPNIKYLIFDADDPRLPEVARLWRPRPGELFRVLSVAEPWERGKFLQWKNVAPTN